MVNCVLELSIRPWRHGAAKALRVVIKEDFVFFFFWRRVFPIDRCPFFVLYVISTETYREYFTTPYFLFIRDTLSYLALLGLHLSICLSPTSVEYSELEWAILIFFMGRIVMEIKQFCVIKVQVGQGSKDKIKIFDLKDANQEEIDELLTELNELHHQSEKQRKNKVEVKRVNKCASRCNDVAIIALKKLKKFTR